MNSPYGESLPRNNHDDFMLFSQACEMGDTSYAEKIQAQREPTFEDFTIQMAALLEQIDNGGTGDDASISKVYDAADKADKLAEKHPGYMALYVDLIASARQSI